MPLITVCFGQLLLSSLLQKTDTIAENSNAGVANYAKGDKLKKANENPQQRQKEKIRIEAEKKTQQNDVY